MQFSEAMQTEADYIVDSFLMLILAATYLIKQGSYLEKAGKFKFRDKKKYDDTDSDEHQKVANKPNQVDLR